MLEPPKALNQVHVRFVPKADIGRHALADSRSALQGVKCSERSAMSDQRDFAQLAIELKSLTTSGDRRHAGDGNAGAAPPPPHDDGNDAAARTCGREPGGGSRRQRALPWSPASGRTSRERRRSESRRCRLRRSPARPPRPSHERKKTSTSREHSLSWSHPLTPTPFLVAPNGSVQSASVDERTLKLMNKLHPPTSQC
jgi:hypothetical protein